MKSLILSLLFASPLAALGDPYVTVSFPGESTVSFPVDTGLVVSIPSNNSGLVVSIPGASPPLVVEFPQSSVPPLQIPGDSGLVVSIPDNSSGLVVSIPTETGPVVSFPSTSGLVVSFPNSSRPPVWIPNRLKAVFKFPIATTTTLRLPAFASGVVFKYPNKPQVSPSLLPPAKKFGALLVIPARKSRNNPSGPRNDN